MSTSPLALLCSCTRSPKRPTTFCRSGESSGLGGAGVSGRLSAVILAAQVIGSGLQLTDGYQQILLVPERAGARIARDFDLPAHHDGLLGAGFLAQAAEHAARHIDIENFGITFDLIGGLGRVNRDAGGRAGPFAEAARDAAL